VQTLSFFSSRWRRRRCVFLDLPVKYAQDWFDSWLLINKMLSLLGLAAVAASEHEIIYDWWAAAPILVSISMISTAAWGADPMDRSPKNARRNFGLVLLLSSIKVAVIQTMEGNGLK
jgi:hypothetical protein